VQAIFGIAASAPAAAAAAWFASVADGADLTHSIPFYETDKGKFTQRVIRFLFDNEKFIGRKRKERSEDVLKKGRYQQKEELAYVRCCESGKYIYALDKSCSQYSARKIAVRLPRVMHAKATNFLRPNKIEFVFAVVKQKESVPHKTAGLITGHIFRSAKLENKRPRAATESINIFIIASPPPLFSALAEVAKNQHLSPEFMSCPRSLLIFERVKS